MGATVAQYTGEIKIFGNVLRVQIKSPALRQNLLMMRTEIARKMNDFVKAQVIQEVTFYWSQYTLSKLKMGHINL